MVIGDEDSGIQGLCLLSCGTPLCAFQHGKSPETIPSRMVLSGKPSLLSVAGIGKGKTRLKSIAFLLLRGGIRNIFRVGIARKHRVRCPKGDLSGKNGLKDAVGWISILKRPAKK
ncbi:MAG: hypothetical protein OC190_10075 [Novosphingobium aromaticivorans]|nr:hypothetical protein [Novosphingobium aromaticivorans]